MKKVAISIGDANGIGLQIAIDSHKEVSRLCQPIYCVHKELLNQASILLGKECAIKAHELSPPDAEVIDITPAQVSQSSGYYSFKSFEHALALTESKQACGVLTLPIHKEAWKKAGIKSIGHTQALRARYNKEAIMMLGCENMYVALFSDHVALRDVSALITEEALTEFLCNFARCINLKESCAVLGLNPHCGDNGLMGNEDRMIDSAVIKANALLGHSYFVGAIPADSAFSPQNRKRFRYFVSMYHDVGLAVLKALYFEESINISLNLPIVRTSVDHGVAFDKAYKQKALSTTSYINALKYIITNT